MNLKGSNSEEGRQKGNAKRKDIIRFISIILTNENLLNFPIKKRQMSD